MLKRIVQYVTAVGMNSYFYGWFHGAVYQGGTKKLCVPILNCWGCPGARFACPIGNLQHYIGLRLIPFYALGFFGAIGAVVGRMACGWLCPFGLLQDLLYKLKTFKIRMPRFFGFLKYVMLVGVVGFVVYLTAEPWFCKLCPDGLLIAGLPLVLMDKTGDLKALTGWHYYMKIGLMIFMVGMSIPIKRFFCRTLCPIGAIYSVFNRFSFLRLRVDKDKCIECDSCQMACPMDVAPHKSPSNIDCIRCLDCVRKCPTKALAYGIK
jgi:polyferredoxin